jgi:hypothetical protein
MKLKPWQKAVIATMLILVVFTGIFVGVIYTVSPKTLGLAGPAATQAPTATPAPISQQGVDLLDRGYNTLDMTVGYTGDTNYLISYYGVSLTSSSGNYRNLGTSAAGKCVVTVLSQDNGYIYAVVQPRSGQALYVDAATTIANNPSIVSSSYTNFNNNGYKEFVFKVSVQNLPTGSDGNKQLWIYPYFITYAAPTVATLSNIGSIGTPATNEYLQWQAVFASAKTGFAVTKVTFALNTTDSTKVALDQINIPGVGYLTSSSLPAPFQGATTLTWTWSASPYDLSGANYLTLGSNQLNQFPFTTEVTTTLVSPDHIQATLTIYGMDQNGAAVAPITSSVVLSE